MLQISRVRLDDLKADGITPLGMFAAAADESFRCFWSSPEEERTLVGVGIADEWIGCSGPELFRDAEAFASELDLREPDLPRDTPLLFGGFAFRSTSCPSSGDSIWSGFPVGRLVLPEVLAVFSSGASEEPVEAILCGEQAEKLLDSLLSNASELVERKSAARHSSAEPEPIAAAASDDSATAYRSLLREAVEAVNTAELEKVVVARQVGHDFSSAPEDVIGRLCETSKNSTVFAFSSAAIDDATSSTPADSNGIQSIFTGASPELLAAKSGSCFTSMALAGSKPLDEADALLGDQKELAEHQFVVDHLCNRLKKAGAELAPIDPPEILRLANIAHLSSRVSGSTSDGILKLVETLHPSPAVAGVPTDAALEFLTQHEQFDRGWYAGPAGWLTTNGDGRFYVALRSLLLRPDECHMFAGSGIVEGSQPKKEEQETWLKLQTAMEALMP